MSDVPDLVQVPREAVRVLVESLQDAWWMSAAAALEELRQALDAPPPADEFPSFGES